MFYYGTSIIHVNSVIYPSRFRQQHCIFSVVRSSWLQPSYLPKYDDCIFFKQNTESLLILGVPIQTSLRRTNTKTIPTQDHRCVVSSFRQLNQSMCSIPSFLYNLSLKNCSCQWKYWTHVKPAHSCLWLKQAILNNCPCKKSTSEKGHSLVATLKELQSSTAVMKETVHKTTFAYFLHQSQLYAREAKRKPLFKELTWHFE